MTNQRFLTTRLYRRGGSLLRPLVKEIVDQHCCLGGERDTWAKVTVEGWGTLDEARSQPVWSVQFDADEGEIWEGFYRGTLHGCCDETDAITFVNLETGSVTFVMSREWSERGDALLKLSVPNSALRRFFAFHDLYTESDPPEAKEDTNVVGVLQYGSGETRAARYVIRWTGGRAVNYRLGNLRLMVDGKLQQRTRDADLWSADAKDDPSALSGFAIVLTLMGMDEPEVVVQVPVVADRLRLDLAVVPAGWALAAVPPIP